jgi:iron complex transport system ATP-binding protein
MLEIRNLNFSYGNNSVLKEITFTVTAGEFISIIGPNGAGKSTLIKMIDGILDAGQSEILLEGSPISNFSRKELAQKIAYLPQDSKFAFDFTVREVVMMGRFPYLKGVLAYTVADLHIVKEVMTLMEIDQFVDRSFNELSGGERQRVLIASALAQQPKILLLDEPTSALDLHHQIAIYHILKKQQKEQNLTIIVVTHDINLAAQYCERMTLMGNGMIIRDDTPENVLQFNLLQEIFGVKVFIDINPLTNSLYILPYE